MSERNPYQTPLVNPDAETASNELDHNLVTTSLVTRCIEYLIAIMLVGALAWTVNRFLM